MPPETPSLSSHRLQRAYRINGIEEARMHSKFVLLEKEKRRILRMANQDIRMVTLSLDYIHASSGHSPEGLAPGENPDVHDKEKLESCFLYGDRQFSRRFGKFRRAQSAPGVSRSRRNSSITPDTSVNVSGRSTPLVVTRPQTSPSRSRVMTTKVNHGYSGRSSPSRPRSSPARMSPSLTSCDLDSTATPPSSPISNGDVVSKIGHELSENGQSSSRRSSLAGKDSRCSPRRRKSSLSQSKSLHSNDNSLKCPKKEEVNDKGVSKDNTDKKPKRVVRKGKPRGRRKKARVFPSSRPASETCVVTVEARNAKRINSPLTAWYTPDSLSSRHTKSIQFKKSVNQERQDSLKHRLDIFRDEYPLPKYHLDEDGNSDSNKEG